jgi:N-methylhydantoinase B/oxoprolinase/acetone carboxylase alpha subunit
VFDFTGTTPEVYGNCNAPRAVSLSAVIYCLRCMVGHDVPLNQVLVTLFLDKVGCVCTIRPVVANP